MQYETSDVMRGRLDQALYDNESLHMMVKDLRSEVDGLQRATTPGTPGLTHGTPLGMRRDSIVTGGSVGSVGMDAAGRPPSSSVRGRLLERRRVSEAGDTLLSARAADSVMGLDELQSPRPVSMGAMLSPPPPAAASLTGTSPVGVRPLSMMTSSLGVQYDDHAHAHHRSQSTSGVQARHGSLNAAAAMGATGPGAGAGGAHHARGQTVSYAVADERRGEDVHGWTSDDGGDHLQRREALDAQLRVLSDEKSQLSFELSRVPASGGKNRQRLAELESQLDVVDKKMAAVRRRMRDMGAI
ncbi:hypothetical protein BC831DRAFT_160884 [Entophlyctis helioformis]|nr:hypothetical protein BC831DRAFT_160884 [Entophlyctis helioformis]